MDFQFTKMTGKTNLFGIADHLVMKHQDRMLEPGLPDLLDHGGSTGVGNGKPVHLRSDDRM